MIGAIAEDVIGSIYEASPIKTEGIDAGPSSICAFTDTNMLHHHQQGEYAYSMPMFFLFLDISNRRLYCRRNMTSYSYIPHFIKTGSDKFFTSTMRNAHGNASFRQTPP